MQRQKDKAILHEKEKKEIIEAREQQIKELPHPYQKEIETCEHLVSFCHQLKVRSGLTADSAEVAKATQQNLLADMNKEQMNRKL